MSKLKLPRASKMGSSKSELPAAGVVKILNGYIDKNNVEKIISKEIRREAQQFDSIADALQSTEKRIVRKRAEKVSRAIRPGAQLTMAGVKAMWTTAMLAHYPKVPPVLFTAKEFAIFKIKIAPIVRSVNLLEFFEFIVESWQSLRETKFNWLRAKGKDVAVSPSLPELMRYWKIFAQAFSDAKAIEASGEARKARSAPNEVEQALTVERAEKERIARENAQLREKLARAERAAYGTRRPVVEASVSLTARRKAVDSQYNDDVEIPHWK